MAAQQLVQDNMPIQQYQTQLGGESLNKYKFVSNYDFVEQMRYL